MIAEITSGRSYFQQGLATTCKDHPYRCNTEVGMEDLGLAHELVVAMKVG